VNDVVDIVVVVSVVVRIIFWYSNLPPLSILCVVEVVCPSLAPLIEVTTTGCCCLCVVDSVVGREVGGVEFVVFVFRFDGRRIIKLRILSRLEGRCGVSSSNLGARVLGACW